MTDPDLILVHREDLAALLGWTGDETAFDERQLVVARLAAAVSGPAATAEYRGGITFDHAAGIARSDQEFRHVTPWFPLPKEAT